MHTDILWYRTLYLYSLTTRGELSESGEHLGFFTHCHNCCNRIQKDFESSFKDEEEQWREFPHLEDCLKTRELLLKEFKKYKEEGSKLNSKN